MKFYKDFRFLLFVIIGFIISQFLWSFITLPYSNPYNILGPLAIAKFNPLNNLLRFIMTVGITIITPFIIDFLYNKYPKILQFLVITGLSIGVVLNNNIDLVERYMKQIDMFHIGVMLGPAYGFLQGKEPYTNIFFLRGLGQDVLFGVISIKIFGYSIGGLLTTSMISSFISLFVFFTLILILFQNDWFYIVSIWFFMSKRVTIDIIKDIGTWVALYLIYRLCTDKKPKKLFSYLQRSRPDTLTSY